MITAIFPYNFLRLLYHFPPRRQQRISLIQNADHL